MIFHVQTGDDLLDGQEDLWLWSELEMVCSSMCLYLPAHHDLYLLNLPETLAQISHQSQSSLLMSVNRLTFLPQWNFHTRKQHCCFNSSHRHL